jgi:antirestriction protein ArdC
MQIHDLVATIIYQIECGAGEWQMPWHGMNASPLCVAHGRKYTGINWLILLSARTERKYTSRYWGTFKQWRARRQSVAAGEKGTAVVRPQFQTSLRSTQTLDGWRVFHVFNGDQVVNRNEGHPDLFGDVASPVSSADSVIAKTGAHIRHGGFHARYYPSKDVIEMPEPDAFQSTAHSTPTQNYYSTALHELVHWTGHLTRENRVFGAWASTEYAFEELVAELGSAYLCGELALETVPRPDHAQYLASWLSAIQANPTLLITAAGLASKAADRILKASAPLGS